MIQFTVQADYFFCNSEAVNIRTANISDHLFCKVAQLVLRISRILVSKNFNISLCV